VKDSLAIKIGPSIRESVSPESEDRFDKTGDIV
jgi:hypothetical protein